jgi:hypothetical protein
LENPLNSGDYFREKGANAERVIHELADRTFFTDWCYPNPKKPDGNELCDLLVVYDDTAIIWQIKDLKVDKNGFYKPSDVEKNIRQLEGARRSLFELKQSVTLSNPRRGPEVFDSSTIKHVHLISVLMGESEEPFPFMQTFKNNKLNVFTREFSDIALHELDTISDFCRYLQAKESITGKFLTVYGGEENLLAVYLHGGRTFDSMAQSDFVVVDETTWDALQSKPEFIAKKQADKVSAGWDSMIDRAHEGSKQYERLARELARPDRFTRRVLSSSFLEAFSELVNSDHQMFRRHIALGDTTYCFLITNDDEFPSPRRRKMLESMCFVARGIPPFNARVVGVATNRQNRSYDFGFLHIPTWTPELEEEKLRIQAATGIFSAPRITKTDEDEYPIET